MPRIRDYYGRVLGEHTAAHSCNTEELEKYLSELNDSRDINHGAEKILNHTAVHFACYGRNEEGMTFQDCMPLLEKYGADIFQSDNRGRQAIHIAANSGKYRPLQYLIKRYAEAKKDIKALDRQGRSIIHAICCSCSSPREKASGEELSITLEHLLLKQYQNYQEKKSALTAKDQYGYTPVELALASGYYEDLAEVFEKYDIDYNLHFEKAKIIPAKHWDFFGRTLLMMAASCGDVAEVNKLVQTEDINEANEFLGGRTALHFAINKNSNTETLDVLLNNPNTNITQQDDFGSNVLHFAANLANIEFFSKVLEKFPIEKIDDKDNHGRTALNCSNLDKIFIKKLVQESNSHKPGNLLRCSNT